MRALIAGGLVTAVLVAFAGCSKKVDLNTANTVGYDKNRDGEPKEVGGPPVVGKGKKAAGPKGPGGGGNVEVP